MSRKLSVVAGDGGARREGGRGRPGKSSGGVACGWRWVERLAVSLLGGVLGQRLCGSGAAECSGGMVLRTAAWATPARPRRCAGVTA